MNSATLADLCVPMAQKVVEVKTAAGERKSLTIRAVAAWEQSLIASVNPRPEPEAFPRGEADPAYLARLEAWYYRRLLAIAAAATDYRVPDALAWSAVRGEPRAPGDPEVVRRYVDALGESLGAIGIKTLQTINAEVTRLSEVGIELLEAAEKHSH